MALIAEWIEELKCMLEAAAKKELHRRIEVHMDQGHGSALLANPTAVRQVHEVLRFGHGSRYMLHAWSVMPNHVHLLLTPEEGWTLAMIMEGLKSVSSRSISRALSVKPPIWQKDYFDRWMRDEDHFCRVAEYIEWNPVKAKLVQDPSLWAFSSANEAARSYVLRE